MAEYMHFSHHKDRELDKTYKEYQTKHGKNYTSLTEHERRKHIFKHNLRCLYFNLAYCIGSPSICFDRVISVPHLTYIFISSFILFYGHYSCTSTWRRIQYTKGRYIWEGTPIEGGISQEVALLATRLGWYASTLVRGPSSCGSCPAIFV